MAISLPQLPYSMDALAPFISEETLKFHYGKHHQAYVNNLNKLIANTEFEHASLEDMIRKSTGGIFNNAAQVWNHTFYWHCLAPNPAPPQGALLKALNTYFGSVEDFKTRFTQASLTLFGSGWAWLVKNDSGELSIVQTHNAGNPLTEGQIPLLTCDVWEHAYYVDVRNARPQYLENFWQCVNWAFVEKQLVA